MDKAIKLIIACEAFKGELEHFKDTINVKIVWVQHSLHDVPKELNRTLNEKIKEAEEILSPGETVLLFFGNCGGALDGIKSTTLNLIYPDVDDCIPIMLGSMEKFRTLQKERPGSFYLNKAWIDSGQGPLGTQKKYQERYGETKGAKVAKRLYKHYKYFTLIDNGCYELDSYRQHVSEAAEEFEKEFIEEKGDLTFVEAVLNNQCRMKKTLPSN